MRNVIEKYGKLINRNARTDSADMTKVMGGTSARGRLGENLSLLFFVRCRRWQWLAEDDAL